MSLTVTSAVAAALAQVRSMKNKTFPMFTKIESVPNAMVPIGQSSSFRGDRRAFDIHV